MADERVTVALLGTGIMGTGMARSMLRAGLTVRVWNRTRTKAEPLAAEGAVVCDNPRQAIAGADVVVTMLRDGLVTAQVVEPVLPAMAEAGALWAQMGTVGVVAIDRLHVMARSAGVAFVDAPVSGTKGPAEQGALLVLASGDPALRERAAPVFDAVGSRTIWVADEPGAGTRLKLVVNNWLTSLTAALAESLALARALGLQPGVLFDTIGGGPLDVPYARLKGDEMLAGDYPPSFPLVLADKDVHLVLAAARAADLELPIAEATARLFDAAVEAGHGSDDLAAVYEAV